MEVFSIFANFLAIILAPIVSVLIAQHLQDRSKKRQDKMDIFKVLMISRSYGWTQQSVDALNIIDIVFSDDKKVKKQWKIYYDKLCVENPTETESKKIKIEQEKLIETIAKSLGYKNKISWETIQNPYIPKGLVDSINQQQMFQAGQLKVIQMLSNSFPNNINNSGGNNNG